MEKNHDYDDILHLSRPETPGHPPMSRIDRAAQFAPFAALTGYDGAIREAARWTEDRIDLEEEAQSRLNDGLLLLKSHLPEHPWVRITCFERDEKKAGGAYAHKEGRVKKIRESEGVLILEDGTAIAFDDILTLDSDLFSSQGDI